MYSAALYLYIEKSKYLVCYREDNYHVILNVSDVN